jgi:hypothetical protein
LSLGYYFLLSLFADSANVFIKSAQQTVGFTELGERGLAFGLRRGEFLLNRVTSSCERRADFAAQEKDAQR